MQCGAWWMPFSTQIFPSKYIFPRLARKIKALVKDALH